MELLYSQKKGNAHLLFRLSQDLRALISLQLPNLVPTGEVRIRV